MKRFLFVGLVLVTVFLMAAPISASKGGVPGPPEKPADGPPVSATCFSPWWADVEFDDFDIVLTRDHPDACVDVLSQWPGEWVATVTRGPDTIWSRSELMMVPRDTAWPSDSCGGMKRIGDSVFEEWRFPPADDARGFLEVPAATVNACPGNAALPGGNDVGEWQERVERAANVEDFTDFDQVKLSLGPVVETEIVQEATGEVHPLAFVVWSHNLRKGESVSIHVDIPPPGGDG